MDMGTPRQTTDFSHRLVTNAHGQPKPILPNAITWLRYAPEWDGVLRYDLFGDADHGGRAASVGDRSQ